MRVIPPPPNHLSTNHAPYEKTPPHSYDSHLWLDFIGQLHHSADWLHRIERNNFLYNTQNTKGRLYKVCIRNETLYNLQLKIARKAT